jgi:hypothetical protein
MTTTGRLSLRMPWPAPVYPVGKPTCLGGLSMTQRTKPLSINMSAIPVAGVGGLGMLAMVAVIAAAFPVARWLLVTGVVGGALLAVALVIRRRRSETAGPRRDLPQGVFSAGAARQRVVRNHVDHPSLSQPKPQLVAS